MRRKHLFWDAVRFLAAGGINTLLTLLLFQVLLFWLPWTIAYTLAFAAGIAFVTWVYPYWVFAHGVQSKGRATTNILYYAVSYVAAMALLTLFTELLALNPRVSVLLVLMIVTPANFLVSRWIFHKDTKMPGAVQRQHP